MDPMLVDRDDPGELLKRISEPEEYIGQLQRLWQDEQRRRRAFVEKLTPERKAEWINGEAVYHSPARHAHNAAVGSLFALLNDYRRAGAEITVTVEKQMIELARSNYEPDVAVWLASTHQPEPGQVLYPPCDLVVEVLSEKTAKRDRGDKYVDYAAAGIREYWIVDADARTIEQYEDHDGAYRVLGIHREGDRLRSVAIEGFEILVAAVFNFAVQAAEGKRLSSGKAL